MPARFTPHLTLTTFTALLLVVSLVAFLASAWAFGLVGGGRGANPEIASAQVSPFGGTCDLTLTNTGRSPATLDQVFVQYGALPGQSATATSFALSGTVVTPGQTLNYDCSKAGAQPFFPFIPEGASGPFTIIAYFSDGIQAEKSGTFAG